MTSRLEPRLDSGSLLDFYSLHWGPIYEAVQSILGPTGIILPIGDPRHGQPNAATFTTIGAEQLVFTWSKAPSTFDTPLDLTLRSNFQGIIPFVTFDGVDEEADSPDEDYWTRGDSSVDGPFSVGAWVNLADPTDSSILARFENATNVREWVFWIQDTDLISFMVFDESANASLRRDGTAVPSGVWVFLVGTYSGNGVNSGIKIYLDGVQVDDTNVDSQVYTAMENTAAITTLGHWSTSAPEYFLDGKMAGGPLGPFFVHKELSGDEVLRLFEIGRRAMSY